MARPSGKSKKKLRAISLFTGAGGLDLGLEAAGFDTLLCVESDPAARATLQANRPSWSLAEPGDIHALSPQAVLDQAGLRPGDATLVFGGPPCQPFSKSALWSRGKIDGLRDPRAMTLRAFMDVISLAQPETMLLENVRGIAHGSSSSGLHLLLEQIERINKSTGAQYAPAILNLNCADYGVPQLRRRVFLVAHRDGALLDTPQPTHCAHDDDPEAEPYLTAWDAIGDLDVKDWPEALVPTGKWAELLPSIPEGENYLWHTPRSKGKPLFGWRTRYWSFLLKLAKNRPSWTVQASPGPATGPFHWRSRRLSVRELCRLQTVPDSYEVLGSHREQIRQIGNAVPSAIGELLGLEIRRQLLGHRIRRRLTLIPERREGCPAPVTPRPVQKRYLCDIRTREDHPGQKRGPGAIRRLAAEADAARA